MDELAESAEICSTPKEILTRLNQISVLLLEVHTTSRQIFDLIDKVRFSYHKEIWHEWSPFLHFANFLLFLFQLDFGKLFNVGGGGGGGGSTKSLRSEPEPEKEFTWVSQ